MINNEQIDMLMKMLRDGKWEYCFTSNKCFCVYKKNLIAMYGFKFGYITFKYSMWCKLGTPSMHSYLTGWINQYSPVPTTLATWIDDRQLDQLYEEHSLLTVTNE